MKYPMTYSKVVSVVQLLTVMQDIGLFGSLDKDFHFTTGDTGYTDPYGSNVYYLFVEFPSESGIPV